MSYETVFAIEEEIRIKLLYAEFRDTKSHGIPRNSGQFRILYGIFGIKKKIRNSV